MIRFDQVTKTFPSGTNALENISFSIMPGEIVAITGPSGAGKTTLLRLLIKELSPSKGTISVGDLSVNNLTPQELPVLRRQIGTVFQDFKLLEDRTATENVALITEILGQEYEKSLETAEKILAQVQLKGKGNLFPRQLSGGELQRVAIARALALGPKILLADEPTGNLDDDTARNIVKLLKNINSTGTTVLIATHNEPLINSLQSRIIKLKDGKIIREK